VAIGVQSVQDVNAVQVRKVTSDEYASLIVENHRAYDVTVAVRILGRNVQVTRLTPETAGYAGLSQTEAVRLCAADPEKPWHWQYRFTWIKGRLNARHDNETLYVLPFEKGRSFRVTQSYGGRLTHRDHDKYAVDFGMREGTKVCAARDGVVVDLMESSEVGGPDRKYKDDANFVSIAHDDGTIGEYLHLERDGVLVEIGDKVKAGHPIALSGNTGYSTVPHLHFGVYSPRDVHRLQSHAITFTTVQGDISKPVEGKKYTAK
jgi:murein DD-endopeptidase MepM/ murein hydrolase activator NlpD